MEESVMKHYLSYSLDKDVRHRASTGGFCKEFIRYSLENKIVDKAIITVLGENKEALVPTTVITNDIEKIMSTKSNTIYDKTNPLSVLKRLDSNENYIFVGLPCHIVPLKTYCKRKNIKVFAISLFCNHTSNNKYYKSVLDKVGLVESDVKHFEYRGSGWAGYVTIITNDGTEIKVNHHECWSNYSEKYLEMLPKCKKCTKFIINDSDICVGDAWLPRVINKDKEGTCIVSAMNTVSDKLIEDCYEKKYIYLEQISNGEVVDCTRATLEHKAKRKLLL